MKIDARQAWDQAVRNPLHRWTSDLDRFRADIFTSPHRAKFTFARNAKVFCIGSCFARNVEEHLIYLGVDVLSKRVVCPKVESPIRPNGFLNKFTTPSIANELEWLISPVDPDVALVEGEGGYTDHQLAPGIAPVSLERARERRRFVTKDYFSRIRLADVVIITLGLVEAWQDTTTGVYWNATPNLWEVRRNPGRFVFEQTDYETNKLHLDRAYEVLRQINPNVRVVVTVSPVPLNTTFSGDDIALANSYSKSVLRAVAQKLADSKENVDYFPSYEIVTMSPRSAAFSSVDFSHVKDAVVGSVMDSFVKAYMGGGGREHTDFVELLYLEANPDVDLAVREGRLVSGYEHWLRQGMSEGRPIFPETLPQWAEMAGITIPNRA